MASVLENPVAREKELKGYVNQQLVFRNLRKEEQSEENDYFLKVLRSKEGEKSLAPIDQRLEGFLKKEFSTVLNTEPLSFPKNVLELDRVGMARILALPENGTCFKNADVESYKTLQGVLHNTKNDRRTTKGVFHVSEGGLPINADKKVIPQVTYGKLLEAALQPPKENMVLPYSGKEESATWVGLHLRPLVLPEVPGLQEERRMEVRFLAPGGLAANLDFVESVFGNAGNANLIENDAAFDIKHFTGTSGCVILAPHLRTLKKIDLGLPHFDDATEMQRQQGVCYKTETELYNDGGAFKITFRTAEGIMVTLIADNYFGYCKKEVKTQIGFSANIIGFAEEEHAGGALVFPSYSLGKHFKLNPKIFPVGLHTLRENQRLYADIMEYHKEGYGIDKIYSNVVYLPADASMEVSTLNIEWVEDGKKQNLPLRPDQTYVYPSGYRVTLQKFSKTNIWHLVGTVAEGCFIHKPSTVSGGGKSEISKSVADVIINQSFYVADLEVALSQAEEVIQFNYGGRFAEADKNTFETSRAFLAEDRSLGSVIKLLTPSPEYTKEYNEWLQGIPSDVKRLVLTLKRFYNPAWGDAWKELFSVDSADGQPGHELMFDREKLLARFLRIGSDEKGNWKTFRLRQDYMPSEKIQMEDDISASAVLSVKGQKGLGQSKESARFSQNCELRLFQRPDEAINRGVDKQTENDFSQKGLFVSNFAPLDKEDATSILANPMDFEKFSEPMKGVVEEAAKQNEEEYFVSSAHPRIVNGAETKNVRYLQDRPDLANPFTTYLADISSRFHRKLKIDEPILRPVDSIVLGRRNNGPDKEQGIRALSVYNPIHYQDYPELMMDCLATLSGKSPSTTGFGSEGALTKSPFNAVRTTADLNNFLVGLILAEENVYSTASGMIGEKEKVDHDISFWLPEIWSRLSTKERDPKNLIAEGSLEKVDDFVFEGREINASRLGYRITDTFVRKYCGRVFANPDLVFNKAMLKPETQNLEVFAEGLEYITESQKSVAQDFFEDQSIEEACPPLYALLHIMVFGEFEGLNMQSPAFRKMFTREELIASEWYQNRLKVLAEKEKALWKSKVSLLNSQSDENCEKIQNYSAKLCYAKDRLNTVESQEYWKELIGTIGADPMGLTTYNTNTVLKNQKGV